MKQVFIVRHAQAEPALGRSDHERALTALGFSDAAELGRKLSGRDDLPQCVFASDSRRTRETAETLIDAAGLPLAAVFDRRIYEASTAALLTVIDEFPADKDRIMLIGHNPGCEDLVRSFTGRLESMPPAAAAVVKFDAASWHELTAGSGILEAVFRPR